MHAQNTNKGYRDNYDSHHGAELMIFGNMAVFLLPLSLSGFNK